MWFVWVVFHKNGIYPTDICVTVIPAFVIIALVQASL